MWKRTSLGMVLALSLSLAGPTQAVPITFAFTGTVTGVRDDGHYLDGSIVSGMGFSGTYTFESSTPDDYPDESWRGQYTFPQSPELVMTLNIGNYSLSAPLEFIYVDNGSKDGYQVRSGSLTLEGKQAFMNIGYKDLTGTVFDNDGLPRVPPDITRFNGFGGFDLDAYEFGVGGQITSITPEPQSGAILLIGVVATFRGKKSR